MLTITPVWRSYQNVRHSLRNSVAFGRRPLSVPASNDMTYQENWDFSVKRLRPIAEILKDHGHSIGLEFIGPATSRKGSKYLFAYSMDAMLGLAAAVGTGNVGLLFDTWHWYTCRSTVGRCTQTLSIGCRLRPYQTMRPPALIQTIRLITSDVSLLKPA